MFLNFLESLRDEENDLLIDHVKQLYLESHGMTEGNGIRAGLATLGSVGALAGGLMLSKPSFNQPKNDPVPALIQQIEQVRSTKGDQAAGDIIMNSDLIFNFEEDENGNRIYHVMGGYMYDKNGKMIE
jgi:hypothetical protein